MVATSASPKNASTSASVGTLVINAAFLQEIKDCNPGLWQLQHQLRQVCESEQEPGTISRQLVQLLDDFRDGLSMQFALEECYGYQSASTSILDAANPKMIMKAHQQHCQLYLEVCDLAEQAEELQYRGVEPASLSKLVTATQAFDEHLRQHEKLENNLIDQLFE